MRTNRFYLFLLILATGVWFAACSGNSSESSDTGNTQTESATEQAAEESKDPMDNKGVGPITSVTLDPEIDQELAAEGKEVYELMCTACHRTDEKFIGPAPKGILERRSPEWIMNMILAPEKMVAEDPDAKQLLIEFNGSPMANQNLTEDQARAILEYFRTL